MLEELCENCPELRGLNLGGWSGLTAENLKYITSACQNLERVDLSFVNVNINRKYLKIYLQLHKLIFSGF